MIKSVAGGLPITSLSIGKNQLIKLADGGSGSFIINITGFGNANGCYCICASHKEYSSVTKVGGVFSDVHLTFYTDNITGDIYVTATSNDVVISCIAASSSPKFEVSTIELDKLTALKV